MTTNNTSQVNGSASRHSARQRGSREGSWTAHTKRMALAGLEAEVNAAMVAAMGADGWKAIQSAPGKVEAFIRSQTHVVPLNVVRLAAQSRA